MVCPYVAQQGACAGSCTEGSLQCSNLTPQTCQSGKWVDGQACPFVCSAGTCTRGVQAGSHAVLGHDAADLRRERAVDELGLPIGLYDQRRRQLVHGRL